MLKLLIDMIFKLYYNFWNWERVCLKIFVYIRFFFVLNVWLELSNNIKKFYVFVCKKVWYFIFFIYVIKWFLLNIFIVLILFGV